jgi:hypothetical protein
VAGTRELKTAMLTLYFERLKALRLARHIEGGILNLVSACLIGVNSLIRTAFCIDSQQLESGRPAFFQVCFVRFCYYVP